MNRLLLVILLSITPVLAHGATYYVAKTGSDGNTCSLAKSTSTPKLTIRSGLACLSGGDTLIIRAGTYTEGIEQGAIPSGISDVQRTIVKAVTGERVTMNGANSGSDAMTLYDRSFITIDGIWFDGHRVHLGSVSTLGVPGLHHFTFQNGGVINTVKAGYPDFAQAALSFLGITGSPHTYILFKNLEMANAGPTTGVGLYLNGTSDSIVENCNIHDNAAQGIQMYNAGGVSNLNRNIIRNNKIHDNGSFGVLIGFGSNNSIYNNLVWGNGKLKESGGMWINYGNINGTSFYNNTLYNNTGVCIRDVTDDNAKIRNNICYQNTNNTITDETGAADISNNLLTNPFFADSSGHNFSLLATSPAIDRGVSISEVTNDFNGVSRPQGGVFDIGAFEYTVTEQQSPPTNLRIEGSK